MRILDLDAPSADLRIHETTTQQVVRTSVKP
ncbi:hypothetical protein ZOSMA_48G00280 [Zostera marina]|uniref:Uncharacterized protein n=1 Tax=Zostera marina TaxID=29655 RepID=A0A0K9NZH7_ZOSMR|nr:hypothetical protein ZOSMA_48G00280 [Zostera marina]